MATYNEYLENRKRGIATQQQTDAPGSFAAYLTQRRANRWAQSVDSFISNTKDAYKSRENRYNSSDSILQYRDNLKDELQNLLNDASYAERYANQIEDATEKESYLNEVRRTKDYLNALPSELTKEADYWSRWKTEDEYNLWKAAAEKAAMQEAMTAEDVQAKIADLEKQIEQAKSDRTAGEKVTDFFYNIFSPKQQEKAPKLGGNADVDSLEKELEEYRALAYKKSLSDEERAQLLDEYRDIQARKEEFDKKNGLEKFFSAVGDNLMYGMSGISQGIVKAADWLLPDEYILYGNNPITKGFDKMEEIYRQGNEEIQKRNAAMSEGWKLVGQLAQGVGSTIPASALALLTGGSSIAGQTAGSAALGAPATSASGILASGMSNIIKDPNFWISAVPTFGNTYEDAKADGATDAEATVSAILNGFSGALIEIGGGIQTIPQGQRSIRKWLKSAAEEGGEEVVQSAVENFIKKYVYNNEIPMLSITDDQAVINPKRAAGEFALGAAVGGLLGGGNMAMDAAIDKMAGRINADSESKTEEILRKAADDVAGVSTNGTAMPNTSTEYAKSAPFNGFEANNTATRQNAVNGNAEPNAALRAKVTVAGEASPVELRGIDDVTDGKVNVRLQDGRSVPLSNISFENPAIYSVYEAAAAYETDTAKAFVAGYTTELPLSAYQAAFELIHDDAMRGVPMEEAVRKTGEAGQMMGIKAQYMAYSSGVNQAKALQNAAGNDTIDVTNTNIGGVQNGAEGVHLRDGSKRNRGSDSGRQVRGVEESAGRVSSRKAQGKPADSGTASLVYGKTVTTASFGIANGSAKDSVRTIAGGETESMKKTRAIAKERGLRVLFFAGNNLTIGNASVRGYISGDRVFIRVDHPYYTAEQLMRHEAGHDQIAKGEIDPNAVRDRLNNTFGMEQVDAIADAYIEAYDGSNLSAEDVWEEIICDSLGNMNIFHDIPMLEGNAKEMLEETRKASVADLEANRTRGSPPADAGADGKESRDLGERRRALRKGEMVNQFLDKINWPAYYQELTKSEYNPDFFDDGATAYMNLDGSLLTLEMQRNGEWSVIDMKEVSGYGDTGAERGRTKSAAKDGAEGLSGQREDDSHRSDMGRAGAVDGAGGASGQQSNGTGDGEIRSANYEAGTQTERNGLKEKFSMDTPIEETKNLLAIHNKNEASILSALELGGLPMPSIAVVKATEGHNQYGPISLVFSKDTIDPQADSRNKVYGSDAWTPTHSDARVDYEVDYDVKREFERNIETLANDVAGGIFSQSSVLDMAGVDDQTSMSVEEIAHRLATGYDSVRAAYLANKGRDIDIVYRTKEFDSFGNDALKSYLDKVGEQEAARLAAKMLTGERLSASEVDTVKDAIMDIWTAKNEWRLNKKPELRETRIAKQREKLSDLRAEDFARNAWDFYENGGTTTDEVDRMETAENLRRAVDDKAVEAWVLDMLRGLTGEPGIYNGSDPFDARGNRKSFKETHWSYTLENIVRAMKNAKARGQGMWGMSGRGLVATATPAYNSVQEMHADESRLRTADIAEYEQMVKDLEGELDRVTADIMRTTEHHASNTFEEEEIIGDVIAMAAQGKRTTAWVKQTFRKEGYTISDKQARAVLSVIEHASSVPTGYFEAKPQRVVGFDEVLAAIIPDDSGEKLRTGLEQAGVRILEYKSGDDADRLAKANSVDGARFSQDLAELDSLRKENALLNERVDYWKGQTKLTKHKTLRQGDLDKLGRGILQSYESKIRIDDIRERMKTLGEYIVNGGENGSELSFEEVKSRATDIARDVIQNASSLVNGEDMQAYKEIRSYLHGTKLSFQDNESIPDYNTFRKHNFGRFTISSEGTPMDAVYQELTERFGEGYFPSDIYSPADQLLHISDLLDGMEPIYENPHSFYMAEAIEYCANDIIDGLLSEDVRQTAPTFADRQEAKLNEQKSRAKQALEKERTRREEKLASLKAHYRTKEAKLRDNRKAAAMRAKILRHVKEMSKELLRPSDKHHIPEALREPVAALLASVNLQSEYTIGEDGRRSKNGEGEPAKRTKAFEELKKAYAKIAGELVIDPDLFGDGMEPGLLDEVISMKDIPIASMNSDQLDIIWRTIRAVEASIRSANKMFSASRFQKVSEAAGALWDDNKEKNGKQVSRPWNKLSLSMLTPESFLHMLGDSGSAVFRMMRDAQDKQIRIVKEINRFTHDTIGELKVRSLERELHTVTLGGKEVSLSTAQLMEFYVLMRREQAMEHILSGGILPDAVSGKGMKKIEYSEPLYGISVTEIQSALSVLTAEQVSIAERLQSYLSNEISEYGNEASMAVYGYKKFSEENYWPIRVNRQETKRTVESDTAIASIANKGFTKSTKPKANTSVCVGSIFDTFSAHATEMATYSAWLGASEDINRIRNFTFRDGDGNRIGTVSGIIDRVHGTGGSAYLQKILSDIALGIKGEEEYLGGLTANYKASAIAANLRVIIQQPTAILRAMSMIDAKYLAGGLKPNRGWEKALKYAPIAQWKDWGYFDIGTGRRMKDVFFDSDSTLEKAKNVSMWMAGKADSMAWGQLWNACEAEMKDMRPEIESGTKVFYEAVAKRFTEIVDHTQVVDGILQRSQIMRSSNGLTKMATAFMGEPTKQYNMFVSAAYDVKNANGKEAAKAKRQLVRTSISLLVSGVVNAMMQSVIDALRDDDKEKNYWEKWLASFTGFKGDEEGFAEKFGAFWSGNAESIMNPFQYIPYAKDFVSILSGYDVTRMDMESIEKTIASAKNFIDAIGGNGKYALAGSAAEFFAESARLIGLPVSNLKREIKSIAMTAAIESENYLMQYRMEKASLNLNYQRNKGTFLEILYNAQKNDRDAYEIIRSDMLDNGWTVQDIETGLSSLYKKEMGKQHKGSADNYRDAQSGYFTSGRDESESGFDLNKLTNHQQESYYKTAEDTYNAIMKSDTAEKALRNIDAETTDALMRAALSMAREKGKASAIEDYSDTPKWMGWASGGEKYGVDEAEAILFKIAYDMTDSSKDENGNAINGSKKENVLETVREIMPWLSGKELEYLMSNYWK